MSIKSATAGDYGKCAINAFTQAENCLAGGKVKRPMQIINNVLLAMLLGVTANFTVLKISRASRKSADICGEMVGIANNSFVSVKVSKELIKEHTTVRRESSDYSGGSGDYSGSGGGSSDGGGSSGGGHSF